MKIKNELWKLITGTEIYKIYKKFYKIDTYHFEETCAWIIWAFAESQEEKQEALRIIKNLKRRSPPTWYLQIKKKYH